MQKKTSDNKKQQTLKKSSHCLKQSNLQWQTIVTYNLQTDRQTDRHTDIHILTGIQ